MEIDIRTTPNNTNKLKQIISNPIGYEFLKKYGYIYNGFINNIQINQILSELNLIKDNENIYIEHLKQICANYDIKGNILEVAGGTIPALSSLIASRQLKLNKGTVTVYDPYIITDFYKNTKKPNMKLYKKKFNQHIDISNFDLIIGIMPCSITTKIINSAIKYNKNFYISMCGCTDFLLPNYYRQILLAKIKCNKEIIIKYLPSKYNLPYPIIYTK